MDTVVVVGPTATGKSALAVELALKLDGEVVSADSRQVYRGLNIGSGKITHAEMKGVPHHMLDVSDVSHVYSAYDYVRDATRAIENIRERGKVPIVCGGTGLYIDMLLGRMKMDPVPADTQLRNELEKLSLDELCVRLEQLDPAKFSRIDKKNKRRLVRAIEIASAIPTPSQEVSATQPQGAVWIGLTASAEMLRTRIEKRLDERLQHGMLNEARALLENGVSHERLEQLGLEYRFMSRHLAGNITEAGMREQLLREIPRYARRQKTWFKRNQEIKWFDVSNPTHQAQVLALF